MRIDNSGHDYTDEFRRAGSERVILCARKRQLQTGIALLVSVLLAAAAAASNRIELEPGHWSYSIVRYGTGNLWVTHQGTLWRFGASGKGVSLKFGSLGLQQAPSAILPHGGSVDLVVDDTIYGLTGSTAIRGMTFPFAPRHVVRARDGYVAIDEDGKPTHCTGNLECRALTFWAASWPLIQGEDTEPQAREVRTSSGALVALNGDRFAWVDDHPYRLTLFTLDGLASSAVVDETAGGLGIANDPAAGESARRPRRSQVRLVVASTGGDRLFVGRTARLPIRLPDGNAASIPQTYIDIIDVEAAAIVKRIRLNRIGNDGSKPLFGAFAGLRDDHTIALHEGGKPPRPSYLVFVSWADVQGVEVSEASNQDEIKWALSRYTLR